MGKSINVFCFSAMFMITLVLSSQVFSQSLVFNTQDFPPFSYEVNGKVAGPAVEIIEAVCKKIDVTCSFNLLPWGRAQKYVEDGKANAMFVIGRNKAREEWLYFSPPIIKTEYGFFVKENNPLEFKEVSNIKGYRVGVYGPSNTSKSLEEIKAKVGDLTIDLRPDDESGFKKLSGGRVDAVFSNRDVGFSIIKMNHLGDIRYTGRYKELNYYIGFSKKFNDKRVVDNFNNVFVQLYENGDMKKILDKYSLEPAEIE